MKRTFLVVFGLGLAIIACRKSAQEATPAVATQAGTYNSGNSYSTHKMAHRGGDSIQYSSRFITTEDANKMINNYLTSINSSNNDSDLRSLTVNADSLRAYLSNSSVKNIKLMLAHTLYWATVNTGINAGYQSGAITIIIAAYDSSGNYVYYNGSNVLDYSAPCPSACIAQGSAASYTLQ